MAKLEENTSLITALTEIEKKVGQAEIDRNTLKTNLSAKGVDTSTLNKMGELVNSIPTIPAKRFASGVSKQIIYRSSSQSPKDYTIQIPVNLDFTPKFIVMLMESAQVYDSYEPNGQNIYFTNKLKTAVLNFSTSVPRGIEVIITNISKESFTIEAYIDPIGARFTISQWYAFE